MVSRHFAYSADTLDAEMLSWAFESEMVPLGFHWGLAVDAGESAELAQQALR
jgi:hypothetical protein